jgi:DNA-binding winged helix-turn-helix (wHTH) protein
LVLWFIDAIGEETFGDDRRSRRFFDANEAKGFQYPSNRIWRRAGAPTGSNGVCQTRGTGMYDAAPDIAVSEPDPAPLIAGQPIGHSSEANAILFGRFVALPHARTLLSDGVPVCVGGRAFDLLMVLLSSRGEVVSKEQIFRFVWPTTTVDESNLRFQMAALRRVLGSQAQAIKTVRGRGYLFAADIRFDGGDYWSGAARPEHVQHAKPMHTSPAAVATGDVCSEPAGEQQKILELLCELLQTLHLDSRSLASVENMLASRARSQIGPGAQVPSARP